MTRIIEESTTEFRPEVRGYQAGGAYWSAEWSGDLFRVYARPLPPIGPLVMICVVVLAVIAAGIWMTIAFYHRDPMVLLVWVAIPIAVMGILWASFGVQYSASKSGDEITFDRVTKSLQSRSGEVLLIGDVARLELVRFVICSDMSKLQTAWLVADLGVNAGKNRYRVLLNKGFPFKKTCVAIADATELRLVSADLAEVRLPKGEGLSFGSGA